MQLIMRYSLKWNANSNAYEIWLQLQNGATHKVPVNSVEEFIAISTILRNSPSFLHPDGTIEYRSN